ncbi:hypothetical protein R1sor_003960 [Riccia sorocarpa]|uniref:Uncharacterized protein n=1 Tax=Riccia sorocarpa TaxID=122646 RepID=A0ABD3H356_9MARC
MLKRCLGPKTNHAAVISFLFEATDAAIVAVIQAEENRVIRDSQLYPPEAVNEEEEPDFEVAKDLADELELSDEENREEAGHVTDVDVYSVRCGDSQLEHYLVHEVCVFDTYCGF